MEHGTVTGPDAEAQLSRLDRLASLWRSDRTNTRLYRQCIELATQLRQYSKVLELADAMLAENPGQPAALFDRANGLIGARDYRGALGTLAELQPPSASDTAAQLNIGLCHYCLQEYAQALPYLEKSYGAQTRTAGLVRMLVTAYHHTGDLDRAKTIAEENAGLAAADAALAGNFALLYLDADDAMRAARWARTALSLDARSIDGRVVEGTLLTMRMQTDRATQMLEGVLADAPQTARAWIGLGTLALLSQDLDRAQRHLERGTELMPMHVGSWHVLGWTLLMRRDIDGAARIFERAMTMDRSFAESHGALAVVAALRGDHAAAQRSIEVALRLDPECLSAKYAAMTMSGPGSDAEKVLSTSLSALAGSTNSALSKLLTTTGRH